MSASISSKRYAQAIFQIAKEKGDFEQWQSSLDQIAVLTRNNQFIGVLENPKLPFSQKANLLKHYLGEDSPLVLNLAYLLVLKNKFRNISQISQQYSSLLDEFRGIKRSIITTAMSLDTSERDKLNQHLESIIGNKLKSDFEVDSEILGGFIARIDGMLIDGSIRRRLLELKNRMISKGK